MSANPYKDFETDSNVEKTGVSIDYGSYQIVIARAGGANQKYNKVLNAKMKPHTRLIENEQLDPKISDLILYETYASTVVLGWTGVTDREGKAIPFSEKACIKLFQDLPALFLDLREVASKIDAFKVLDLEESAGNSQSSCSTE